MKDGATENSSFLNLRHNRGSRYRRLAWRWKGKNIPGYNWKIDFLVVTKKKKRMRTITTLQRNLYFITSVHLRGQWGKLTLPTGSPKAFIAMRLHLLLYKSVLVLSWIQLSLTAVGKPYNVSLALPCSLLEQ